MDSSEGNIGNSSGEGSFAIDKGSISDDSSSEVKNKSRNPRHIDRDNRFSFVTGTKGGTSGEGGGNESKHGWL